ncbi:MAG TPA: twin-arginine translocation signal domain-containing protein, partial [Kofleriaceae bacterium]
MRRRQFLGLVGGASAAAIAGPYLIRRAHAQFGAFPAGTEAVTLPEGLRAKRVLEVFLYGGLSQWETLYFVRNYGTPGDPQYANQQYYTYASSNATMISRCGGGSFDTPRAFGQDALGSMVEIGPFADRLWQRTDVLDR